MTKVIKSAENPYGLSVKQQLVIDDILEKISQGKPFDPIESTQKYYNVKNRRNAVSINYQNMYKSNYREALIAGFRDTGVQSKLEKRLEEGLDAKKLTKWGEYPDYQARLEYIKEIHKVTDSYAPERKQVQTFSLIQNTSEEELDEKIAELQLELES